MAVQQVGFTFVDAKGQKAQTRVWVVSDTAAHFATWIGVGEPLFGALTNAGIFGIPGAFGGRPAVGTYGTASDYQDITLKAVLVFVDTQGGIHRFGIPSPKRSIFLADGTTVDEANTDVVALATHFITGTAGPTNASDRDGNGLSKFVGGFLSKKRQRRRLNIFILNPAETGPAE